MREQFVAKLADGKERQAGRSVAVAEFGRVGCLGASPSFGLRFLTVGRKSGAGVGCNFNATERAHSETAAGLTRNAGGEVWSRYAGRFSK